MSNDINRIFLIGRLTKDPDLRYTQGGTTVASFTIANNRTYTVQNEKKDQVSFFNCVAWSKGGEVIAQYCKKGQRIGIEGRLQQRSWQDHQGQKRSTVEIVVDNFQFLEAKKDGVEQSAPDSAPLPTDEDARGFDQLANHFSDDDVPF